MSYDTEEGLDILARAHFARNPSHYDGHRLYAAQRLLEAVMATAKKAGHEATPAGDRGAEIVTKYSSGRVWLKATARGIQMGAEQGGGPLGDAVESELEYDPARGDWTGTKPNTYRLPKAGERHDVKRSAVAVVAEDLAALLAKLR